MTVDDCTTTVAALAIVTVVGDDGRRPPRLRAECRTPDVWTRVVEGRAVVTGRLAHVTVDLGVEAPAYEPERRAIAVTPATAPVRVDLRLRARPVRVSGQVRRTGLLQTAVGGARVDAVADVRVPGLFPFALRLPLRGESPVGAPVQPVTVTPAGADLLVSRDARAGSDVLSLADRTGLAAGVTIRAGDAPRHQIAEVVALDPPGPGPGDVRLRDPLLATVPAGTAAVAVTLADTGASGALQRRARDGDGLLALTAALAADAVRVGAETYAAGAVADAHGYYHLAGLRGTPAVALLASAAGFGGGQPATLVELDPSRPTTTADLGLRP